MSCPSLSPPGAGDYLFAGACAFTLGSTSQGWGIGLASNNAIIVAGGTVTVNTLETHRLAVGDVVYLNNVAMTTGIADYYNATFLDDGTRSAWSGGFPITKLGPKYFAFAAATGQNDGDVGGAAGVLTSVWASRLLCVTSTTNPARLTSAP